MTTIPASTTTHADIPRLYLACPLTGLDDATRRQLESDIAVVRRAVDDATVGNRATDEMWPLSIYAPFDNTAPWTTDPSTPREVYRRNLIEVHQSDGLIVVAENGASAGVGQEIEWAVQLGIPVLYLSASEHLSRQIAGTPAPIDARSYNKSAETLASHVQHFLREWRNDIADGPRRRASRRLRFEGLSKLLMQGWKAHANPTDLAARLHTSMGMLDIMLSDPTLVAVLPADLLLRLAAELHVALNPSIEHAVVLPVPAMRALFAAADTEAWPDNLIEQLIFHGRAALHTGRPIDLTTIKAWKRLAIELVS